MSFDEFEQLIASYGGKSENWPEAYRADMLAMIADTPKASALLAREQSLDGWLDARLPDAPTDLSSKITAQMDASLALEAAPETELRSTNRATMGATLTMLAACLVGGFVMAPTILDAVISGNDLMASLEIITGSFMPTEPL